MRFEYVPRFDAQIFFGWRVNLNAIIFKSQFRTFNKFKTIAEAVNRVEDGFQIMESVRTFFCDSQTDIDFCVRKTDHASKLRSNCSFSFVRNLFSLAIVLNFSCAVNSYVMVLTGFRFSIGVIFVAICFSDCKSIIML